MEATSSFHGKLALVTGAGSGIGLALAHSLARQGARLVLIGRNAHPLRAAASELGVKYGVAVDVVPYDLDTGVEALWASLGARGLHKIDILVNCAGAGDTGAFAHSPNDRAASLIRLNCQALTDLTRLVLPHMLAERSGFILQVSSMSAFFPMPFMAVYAASKAYVSSFTAALREELRGSGVRVSCLCPGPVQSNFQARAGYVLSRGEESAAVSPAQVAEEALAGLARNQGVVVPGASNRFVTWLLHFVPNALLMFGSAIFMRRSGRSERTPRLQSRTEVPV